MSYLYISSWYEGTHKKELQETKQKALSCLKTMLMNIEKEKGDSIYLDEAIKNYDILVSKMAEEDQKLVMHHFSLNHFCVIAQQLREIQKTKKNEILDEYIKDIYRIMNVIHKAHTNNFKWEKYSSDLRFIENVLSYY